MIRIARRGAATGENNINLRRRILKARAQRITIITNPTQINRAVAQPIDQPHQHWPVGIKDLPRSRHLPGLYQFVPGAQYTDPEWRKGFKCRHSDRRHQRQIGRGNATPPRCDDIVGLFVLSCGTRVGAGPDRAGETQRTIRNLNIFLQDDRIDTIRQGGPCQNAHCLPIGHRLFHARASCRSRGHQRQAMCTGPTSAGKTVAVNSRIWHRRMGTPGYDVARNDAPKRLGQRRLHRTHDRPKTTAQILQGDINRCPVNAGRQGKTVIGQWLVGLFLILRQCDQPRIVTCAEYPGLLPRDIRQV